MADRSSDTAAYSVVSIIAHWLGAVLIIALFLTHEAERGTSSYAFHVGGGALAGLLLLWRVWRRIRIGFTENPNQNVILLMLSKSVLWGFLVCIVVVVISGYLLPWTLGKPLELFGTVSIPSPINEIHFLDELMDETHDVAGHLFLPLLGLHILGWAKHAFVDKDGSAARIFKPVSRGL